MTPRTPDLRPEQCLRCGTPLAPGGTPAGQVPDGHAAHAARGLCTICWPQVDRAGELGHYRRAHYPAGEILDAWVFLRARSDCSRAQAAEAMGIECRRLELVLYRARKRGDPRAVPGRNTRYQPKRTAFRDLPSRGWARPQHFDLDTRDEGEEATG